MNNDLIRREDLMPLFVEKAQTMKDRHGVKLGENWLLNYDDIEDVISSIPAVNIKPFANVTFDKEELNKIIEERIIEPIKRKELVISYDWIPVGKRMPEERINPDTNDFEYVLCSTIWDDVRSYKFGRRIGGRKAHFWYGGEIMDEYITAWQPLPKPYKEGGAEHE